MGKIYGIWHKTAEKYVYVGKTSSNASNAANSRFNQHKTAAQARPGSKTASERLYVEDKMAEFGPENFDVFVLEDDIPEAELGAKEKEYIAKHNTYHEGWNHSFGG